jgi:hypothetical protein
MGFADDLKGQTKTKKQAAADRFNQILARKENIISSFKSECQREGAKGSRKICYKSAYTFQPEDYNATRALGSDIEAELRMENFKRVRVSLQAHESLHRITGLLGGNKLRTCIDWYNLIIEARW